MTYIFFVVLEHTQQVSPKPLLRRHYVAITPRPVGCGPNRRMLLELFLITIEFSLILFLTFRFFIIFFIFHVNILSKLTSIVRWRNLPCAYITGYCQFGFGSQFGKDTNDEGIQFRICTNWKRKWAHWHYRQLIDYFKLNRMFACASLVFII